MTYVPLLLLLAAPSSANRLAMPRLNARAPVAGYAAGAVATTGVLAAAPVLSLRPLALAPALLPADAPAAPSPAPAPAAAPADLLGRTAQAMAAVSPERPEGDRELFEAMFAGRHQGPKPWTDVPGSPKVVVGASAVDRRATGARELLKTLVLPHSRPVLGLFTRYDDRIVNGYAMGTEGIYGHKDAVPPGFDVRHYGGYSLRLALDGTVQLVGSGHLPADLSARLLRNLKRYYGITPAVESGWAKLRRGAWAAWDAVSAFFHSKS
jgi:hypothetical protein